MREVARGRVEGSRDGMERIARELGIARWTLVRWRTRFGWRRPAAPRKIGPDFYRSKRLGRAYGGDAVGVARDLLTGSGLSIEAIAARAGVSRATVYRWAARRGWRRRPGAEAGTRHHPPYAPEVVAAARELYRTTELPVAFIAARVKATHERVWHWARRGGWTRPRDLPDACDGRGPHGRGRRRRGRRRL